MSESFLTAVAGRAADTSMPLVDNIPSRLSHSSLKPQLLQVTVVSDLV